MKKWISDPLIQVIRNIDTQNIDPIDLAIEQLIGAAIHTRRLYVWLRNYMFRIFLTCVCAGIPLTLDFGKYRQN